jgi:hypothetical protein
MGGTINEFPPCGGILWVRSLKLWLIKKHAAKKTTSTKAIKIQLRIDFMKLIHSASAKPLEQKDAKNLIDTLGTCPCH